VAAAKVLVQNKMNIFIDKQKLIALLSSAFDEGMYGYKDLKEEFIEKLVEEAMEEKVKEEKEYVQPSARGVSISAGTYTSDFYTSGGYTMMSPMPSTTITFDTSPPYTMLDANGYVRIVNSNSI